jgi:hypothetical protein
MINVKRIPEPEGPEVQSYSWGYCEDIVVRGSSVRGVDPFQDPRLLGKVIFRQSRSAVIVV